MNFSTFQSLNAYTRNMEMQMKWQKKQDTSDFTADGSMKLDLIDRQAEEIRQSQADGSDKLSKQIDMKLNSGQKLTAEEKEYLRKNDPQTYQRVKAIEAEQKNYENELKRCRTKDEVERVKMAHTAASLNAVNSIMHNPVIPEEKKFELVMQEHRKNQAFQETTKEFVESGRYAQLPTEEERLKAEKDLKEAEEAERGIEDPAEKKESEKDGENGIIGSVAQEIDDSTAERAVKASEAEKDLQKLVRERELTRMEAETTPEALKVKRARARAAYRTGSVEEMPQMVDVKVK